MGIGGLQMHLEQMQISIEEMMDITAKIKNGELSSKNSCEIEARFIVDIFKIRRAVNTISTYIVKFVDNLE